MHSLVLKRINTVEYGYLLGIYVRDRMPRPGPSSSAAEGCSPPGQHGLLCDKCERQPLDSYLYGPYTIQDKNVGYFLGNLLEVLSNVHCSLCGLVKQIMEQYYGAQYLEDVIGQDPTMKVLLYRLPFSDSHDESDEALRTTPILCVLEIGTVSPRKIVVERRDRETIHVDENKAGYMPKIFALSPSGICNQASVGAVVQADKINWEHVKGWLTACGNAHEKERKIRHSPDEPKTHLQLRVVDVESVSVVPVPTTAAYVALSYQWGMDQKLKLLDHNKQLLHTPGCFNSPQSRPSQTIVDAMTVTKYLGYRYLWVDALCIIQNSDNDVDKNVNMMDQIYRNAELTIVAAAGQNAEYGLPGVSVSRTEKQFTAIVKGITLANRLEPVNSAISFSRWNTRGWTYQERVLSRQLLIFTESCVSYECDRRCAWAEETCPPFSHSDDTLLNPRTFLDFECRDVWELYAIAVAQYTRRFLGKPSDRLRAFSGLTSFLAKPYRSPFVFGLPTALFDVALLWRHTSESERRNPSLPSWSWAGWTGSAIYALVDSMLNMCECTISQADIVLACTDSQLCVNLREDPNPYANMCVPNSWQRHFDPETLCISYFHPASKQQSTQQPITYPRPFSPLPSLPRPPSSHILRVHAQVATFRVTTQHCPDFYLEDNWSKRCKLGEHVICYLAILDHSDRRVGSVQVNEEFYSQLLERASGSFRFLALSRSTYCRIDLDPTWDESEKGFRHWTKEGEADDQENSSEDDEEEGENLPFTRRKFECFDREAFSAKRWWPMVNVLLLSGPESKDQVVERVGIGKVHVAAWEVVGMEEDLLLG